MIKNMGAVDRVIRVILAALFFTLAWGGTVTGALAWILILVGAVFAITAIIGTCPAYIPLGIDTRGKKSGT